MKAIIVAAELFLVATVAMMPAYARGGHAYGGGHHTSSHGGHYSGGIGSSHRGGTYHGPYGGYGTHQ